jgi:tRNA nucleotidyltransferase (CCA-adding enzyme)
MFEKTIPTGIKHGTVSVLLENEIFEITTYRVDGEYSDGRHPDEIFFTSDIKEDLKRRDFTINAIAYNQEKGIVDPFDGISDIKNRLIRCVGNPDDRFNEDSLRMMRAIRFSAQLGFRIEENTYYSIRNNASLIDRVSYERIQMELNKILLLDSAKFKLLHNTGILKYIIPEVSRLEKVEQNTPYHRFDVYRHTLTAVDAIEVELDLKLTMLFHDTGKYTSKTTDENGRDHFYGHANDSVKITEVILDRLKYSNQIKSKVLILIKYHDYKLKKDKKSVKKLINKLGSIEMFREWLKVRWSDIIGKNPKYIKSRILDVIEYEKLLEEIIKEDECYSVKDLAVTGNDLMEIGFKKGKLIGTALKELLDVVIENPEFNEKEKLIEVAKERKEEIEKVSVRRR